MRRNLTFSLINILGLTFGLAITSLIVLYVSNELTYDTFHKDSDDIYRLYREVHMHGFIMAGDEISVPFGPYLKNNYPQVIEQTRVAEEEEFKVIYGVNEFKETLLYVDSTFFNIFSFKFIYGDPSTALNEPFSMVLTKSLSRKIFGNANPLGAVIKSEENKSYKVTAVIEDVPENSHLKFDALSSFSTQYSIPGKIKEGWGLRYSAFSAYVKLKSDAVPDDMKDAFDHISKTYLTDPPNSKYVVKMQPLKDIYLYHGGGGDISRIILFSVIGLFVLIIACINYMNLNTAESIRRLKEIGMRKVLGVQRKTLIWQLIFESIFIAFISMVLALTLAEFLLPGFNIILQKNLRFDYFNNPHLIGFFVAIVLFAGFLAGTYPAFYLSAIKPVNSLKGKFVFGSIHAKIRNVLVVFQFAITIFLLSCTGIIYMQIQHATTTDLGFTKDNILVLDVDLRTLNTSSVERDAQFNKIAVQLQNEFNQYPQVEKTSIVSGFPYGHASIGRYKFEGLKEPKAVYQYSVDEHFIDMLDIEIIDGRAIEAGGKSAEKNVVVNEKLVRDMNWDKPIGEKFKDSYSNEEYTVIGVCKDFHHSSLHRAIQPVIIGYSEEQTFMCSLGLKLKEGYTPELLDRIAKVSENINTSYKIDQWFLSQKVAEEYEEERNTGLMFTNFAIIAIIIACMGLYGLALFMSRQKVKEIGIRKIFGSSITEIILNLSKLFIRLIIVAAAIAIPAAWYYMDIWLQSFVYQVENRWVIFIFSTIIAIMIAFITIFYQSLRAANRNPIDAIRYE